MSKTIEFLQKFCDGTGLGHFEIDELKAANYIAQNPQDKSWFVTAVGHAALQPPGEDMTQGPDDDSYFPPPVRLDQLVRAERTVKVRAERDPLGKHQHETGAKLDAGKVRLGLVLGAFSNALVEVGKVGTYGAQKYTDNGWLDVPKGKARYTDALLRHIFAEANESHDPDTNLHHAAHAAWNALARLELILRKRGDE